jgi:hypothetical protein
MAYDEAIRNITLTADASLAGYTGVAGTPGAASPHFGKAQYRFVKVTGAKQCGLATAAGDAVVGVCQNKPQVAGEAATVAIRGVSRVLAGGAFIPGDKIDTDANGRAIKSGAGNGIGIALEAATVANELSSVLLRCN